MPRRLLVVLLPALAALVAGCGQQGIELATTDPLHPGAELFQQRCGGCHTFEAAGTEGSNINPNSTERKDGPNFDTRPVAYDEALFAIQNGGFSSGPMPQNIVVGEDARVVACFVAVYSGKDATRPNSPGSPPLGTDKETCISQLGE